MDKEKINMNMDNYMVDNQENILSSAKKQALDYFLSKDEDMDILWGDDKSARKELDSFMEDEKKKMAFLGYSGSGKTSFLRQYFSLSKNETFWIRDNCLLIFHSDDGNGIVEYQDSSRWFADEFERICKYCEYKYMANIDEAGENPEKFYQFVLETKSDVLSCQWLGPNLEKSVYEEQINNLKAEKRLTYYIMKLKYYLLFRDIVNKVILVCDNIESAESYVNLAEKVNGCIRRYNNEKYLGYSVKTIFVMNKEIYSNLYDSEKATFDKMVIKERNIILQDLFDLRFCNAEKYGEEWMKKRGFSILELKFAKSALDELNTKYNGKYQKMILGLSMYEKNQVLQCYKKIIFNQTWVRKEKFYYDLEANEENKNFLFTNITCIRALACGNEQMYNPDKNVDYFIPNILYNTEEEDYGIYNLLLMKYYVRCKGADSTIEHNDIIEVCKKIWGMGIEYENFKFAHDYLLRKKVLERYCTEDETRPDYVITLKGAELWDMLRSDSVLMELYREDYYRYPDSKRNMDSSYKLINTGRQYKIFEDLLYMIKDFCEWEDKLYQIAKERGNSLEYEYAFGKKRMAFYLLEGIIKSINYSISRSNDYLKRICNEVEYIVNMNR